MAFEIDNLPESNSQHEEGLSDKLFPITQKYFAKSKRRCAGGSTPSSRSVSRGSRSYLSCSTRTSKRMRYQLN